MPSRWHKLREELHKDYPKSVFLIRDRMRQRLGFTVREHAGYRMRTKDELYEYDRSDHEHYDNASERQFFRLHTHERVICLDFYDERKYTMFLLKYSELLQGKLEHADVII